MSKITETNTNETVVTNVGSGFVIQFPEEFKIPPTWEFQVSPSYTARIWERTTTKRTTEEIEYTYYMCEIVHNTTGEPHHNWYHGNEGSDLLILRMNIEKWQRSNRPKKSKSTRSRVVEEEEDKGNW